MWLLLVIAEKGCRKVTRLSCKSKTYLGVCHRHSLFTNEKKTTSGLRWLLEIHTQRKAINVNTQHYWTQGNKIRAESYYQQLFMTLSNPATLLVLCSDHSWYEQLLDVSMQRNIILVPLMRKWPHYWVGCVHKLSRSLDLSANTGKTSGISLLTEKLSYIFSVFRGNFIISGTRT